MVKHPKLEREQPDPDCHAARSGEGSGVYFSESGGCCVDANVTRNRPM
jgi:hypothetical protein